METEDLKDRPIQEVGAGSTPPTPPGDGATEPKPAPSRGAGDLTPEQIRKGNQGVIDSQQI